jgi:hypothetical protein
MRPYKFYIQNDKAVRHPLNGGNVESFAGSSLNPAVQVTSQGGKVLVTFQNGQVQESPWPGEGGNMRTLVQGQNTRHQQEVNVSENQYYDTANQNEDIELEEFAASPSYYETPKKRSCLGCLFKLVILAIIGFFALAALGFFLDKGKNKKSEKAPTESESTSPISSGETQDSKIRNVASPDQEKSTLGPEASKASGNSGTFDAQS